MQLVSGYLSLAKENSNLSAILQILTRYARNTVVCSSLKPVAGLTWLITI